MKEGWKYRLFKDVFPIKMGKTPPRGDKSSWDTTKESDNKWVSISDISQNEGKIIFDTKEYITDAAAEKIFRVKANSLLMSFKLTIGKMAFAGTDLYTNEAIIAIPENKEYNLKFLYFYLSSYNWSLLTDGSEKVKGKTLNKESIGRIKLPIISLPEQQRIVSYLDAQFAKIDQLKENAEKASLEARLLLENSISKLTKPQNNWESKELKDLCTICGEYGLNESATGYNGIRYIRITDITADGELNEEKVSATNKGDKRQEKLKEGDILFARTGATVGKTLVYKDDFGDCVFAGYLIRYRTNPNIILPKYLFYYTHSSDYYEWVKQNQAAAAQPNISAQKYNKLIINFPPDINEQQEIINKLDKFYNKCKQLENINTQILFLCNDLKQSLLKQIFE